MSEARRRRQSDVALERMAELLKGLAETPRLEEITRGALELLAEVFGFPYLELFEVDPESGEIRLARSLEGAGDAPLASYRGRVGEGILGHAALTGEPVLVADSRDDTRFIPFLEGSRTELAVPIRVGGSVRYILNIESTAPGDLDHLDRGLVDTLAGIVGAGFKLAGEMERREALTRLFLEQRDAARDLASHLEQENRLLKGSGSEKVILQHLVAFSPAMRELVGQVEAVKDTMATVLVQGPTGSGKELIARTLHSIGPRRTGPFISVNAANLQAQLFESELFGYLRGAFSGASADREGLARAADGGTLFLDEIGELSLENQAKFLRFLDHKEVRPLGSTRTFTVDARLIAATNRDLEAEVRQKAFREDLFYRLRVIQLRVPSLRERRDDLPLLIFHFVKHFSQRDGKGVAGVADDAMDALLAHAWEGNVRELKHEVERAVALTPQGDKIRLAALSEGLRPGGAHGHGGAPLRQRRSAHERDIVLEALERNGWNVTRTASELGLSRVGLTKKLKRLGIARPGDNNRTH